MKEETNPTDECALSNEQFSQIVNDPENQPHQLGKLIWNGNELVFEVDTKKGVAGISPDMPNSFGEEIAKRWNAASRQQERSC